MKSTSVLRWTPRVLAIAFVLFLSLFALDAFNGNSGWAALLAFVIHLVPSLVLVTVAALAWKREWVGALVFVAFAVWYVWEAGFGRPWSWYAFIAGPAALTGILYLASWWQRRR